MNPPTTFLSEALQSSTVTGRQSADYVDVTQCPLCASTRLEPWAREVGDYELVRCKVCAFICVGHRPTTAAISVYYSSPSQYDGWEAAIEPRRKMWERRVALLRGVGIGGAVLDVGTGIGQFLALVKPHVQRVVGTEVSSSACEVAKRRFGLDIHHGVLETVGLSERFNLITLFHVVEHVDDPVATIRTCVGLLRDDGMVAMAVPNEIQGARFRLARLLRRVAPMWIRRPFFTPAIDLAIPDNEIHLNYFTPATASRLFATCGLKVEAVMLDPYYPLAKGPVTLGKGVWYQVSRLIKALTGYVAFDAFIVIGRRDPG